MMTGMRRVPRLQAILAARRVMHRHRAVASRFESTKVKTMEKLIHKCSLSIGGPGVTPRIRKAANSMAEVAPPGTPNAKVGISSPPADALLALSGAITPRIF